MSLNNFKSNLENVNLNILQTKLILLTKLTLKKNTTLFIRSFLSNSQQITN